MDFTRTRDEQAFRILVEKHAALVLGVCRQILRCSADVDDAFQATFFVLATRASTIKAADSLASWLYQVAFRTACHAAKRRAMRKESALEDDVAAQEDPMGRSR